MIDLRQTPSELIYTVLKSQNIEKDALEVFRILFEQAKTFDQESVRFLTPFGEVILLIPRLLKEICPTCHQEIKNNYGGGE